MTFKYSKGDSLCAFCSRFKRGLLYSCCRNFKYNKLVLAQHLDDLAESFFMSALHNGQVRTMKANYEIDAGDCRVIRPLAYVRESATRDFAVSTRLPIINENCPACFEQPKERDRIKKLLSQEEAMVPALFFNLRKAFLPFLHDDTYDAMDAVIKKIEERAREPKTTVSSKRDQHVLNPKRERTEEGEGESCFKRRPSNEATNASLAVEPGKVMVDPCTSKTYCPPCYELC